MPGQFRWCSYWPHLNYVLSVHGHRVREFALTPINSQYPETWNDREFYRVREHCTPFGEHDECASTARRSASTTSARASCRPTYWRRLKPTWARAGWIACSPSTPRAGSTGCPMPCRLFARTRLAHAWSTISVSGRHLIDAAGLKQQSGARVVWLRFAITHPGRPA